MKASYFLITVVSLCHYSAGAQSLPPAKTETSWVMRNDSLVGALVLDKDQRVALIGIERDYQEEFDLLAANDTLDDATMRHRMEALRAEREGRIKAVLTPAQFEQWLGIIRPEHHIGDTQ